MRTIHLCLFILALLTGNTQATELSLLIKEIDPSHGKLHIGIYNSENGFPEIENTFWNKIVKVSSNSFHMEIRELPPGKYCVSVFHDKNSNDIFDFSIFGWPLESYGFSKNIFHRFRSPEFNECAFALNDKKSLTIYLNK